MKISELVERTATPKETIHYYIREGVLRKPRKTGRNIADYSETYVDQIRIIKGLQENYFLPLSVIKKIIKRQKKQSLSEKSSFEFLNEYFKPLDRLLTSEIAGREAFRKATGLSRKWLAKMEEWAVVTAGIKDGHPVYSQDDVILGRLLVDMDRIGFGPKDGYDPEDIKRISDFLKEYVATSQKGYYQSNLERLNSKELVEKGSRFTEIMSLFFYHLYRKLVRDEYGRLRRSLEKEKR
ncbi:MAG: MerR family transcriptional regulator [Deltaproteobacteria bacterium]|nr:MerR family transcriptional regulator [Deltaproteobacteria bacterium]